MLIDEMHESGLVEQREHAVEVLKVIFEEGQSFGLWGEWLVYSPLEYVAEDVGFPLYPLVVVDGRGRDHVLEGGISSLFIHPLYTFRREDGEARRRSYQKLASP